MPSIELLGLGNTIVDIEYKVTDRDLETLGVEKGGMTLIDTTQFKHLHHQLGMPIHRSCGGSVANSLFVAQLWGLATHHVGVVGSDELSDFVIDECRCYGISHSFEATKKPGDTGCCFVLITPDGERSMVTHLGLSSQFGSLELIRPLANQSQSLFIEGYLLADEAVFTEIITTALPMFPSSSVILSLSDAGLASHFKERFMTIFEYGLGMIFCNFQEALSICNGNTIEDIELFFKPICKETIVTDGENGAYILSASDTIHVKTNPKPPTDTTGAGDAFAGTYLAHRQQGHSIEDSARMAHQVCSIVISHFGARPQEVSDFIVKTANLNPNLPQTTQSMYL
jgi:sugar/nucleoside kinase (ribokinase family)